VSLGRGSISPEPAPGTEPHPARSPERGTGYLRPTSGAKTRPAGTAYRLVVVTQSRTTHGAGLLKEIREVKSAFTLTARSDSGSRNN